jgi:hypothetical protein
MEGIRKVIWLKYVIAVLVAAFAGFLLEPSASGDSPGRTSMRIAIIVAAFAIIIGAQYIWAPRAPRSGNGLPIWRYVTVLALLAITLLALSLARPWVFQWLGGNPKLEKIVGRVLEAGGGLVLPMLMLAVFSVLWFARHRRSH